MTGAGPAVHRVLLRPLRAGRVADQAATGAIVTVVLNVALAAFYTVTQVLVYRWALSSWPAEPSEVHAPAAGPSGH